MYHLKYIINENKELGYEVLEVILYIIIISKYKVLMKWTKEGEKRREKNTDENIDERKPIMKKIENLQKGRKWKIDSHHQRFHSTFLF